MYNEDIEFEDNTLENEETIWITFSEGEQLENCKLEDITKQTQPRPRLKEATLVKELQKLEIGRPSTYATILGTVLSTSRGYCELDSKSKQMVPTELGIQLIGYLDRSFSNLINPVYTKEMEAALDKIANNKLDDKVFLKEFYDNLIATVKNNTEDIEDNEQKICPKCGNPMVIRRNKWGKLFYGCSTYPKCDCIINK